MRRRKTNEEVDSQLVGRQIQRIGQYLDNKTPIEWLCKDCGTMWIARPIKVLVGKTGCPVCSRVSGDNKRRKSRTDFIEQSKELHHNKYQYDKVIYKNSHTKVTIVCPVHGDFEQSPTSHLSGNGCCECMADSKRDTTDAFIAKAQAVHGDRYDYTKFVYVGSRTKGTIRCRLHGDFEQRPNTHLAKRAGCPTCDVENRKGSYSLDYFNNHPTEKNKPGCLYVVRLQRDHQSFIKIGVAVSVQSRLDHYYGVTKTLIFTKQTTLFEAYQLEQQLLCLLKAHRFYPPYKFDGYTECVKDRPDVLGLIEEHLVTL